MKVEIIISITSDAKLDVSNLRKCADQAENAVIEHLKHPKGGVSVFVNTGIKKVSP